MMITERLIRYQGAIVKDHHLLLIKEQERATGRMAWFFPGGGMEEGETPEECVRREMKEETGLGVEVQGLLLDGPEVWKEGPYQRHLTYLCKPVNGEAKPGFEPVGKEEGHFTIVGLEWFDLRDEAGWEPTVISDHIAYLFLHLVRKKLGYLP
jgi:8-oxo-dGTP pyrophosphatase MutT (NUDIX family)